MGRTFHILDVFTKVKYGGNQLAVVEDADGLSSDEMQVIAKEFGFSETVFLQTSENELASARVRIFTPSMELQFAGHPTIGTAVLLAELKHSSDENDTDALLLLEEGFGLVRCAVSLVKGQVSYAEFDAPKLPELIEKVPEADLVADALGIGVVDVGFENHKIMAADIGVNFLFVPVKKSSVLRRAKPDFAYWDDAMSGLGEYGVYVYCRDEDGGAGGFNARMFAPSLGVPEDPATGGGAVAFAKVIEAFEIDGQTSYETYIEQGLEMGRPSLIKLELELTDKQIRSIRLGGHAVRVASGELY